MAKILVLDDELLEAVQGLLDNALEDHRREGSIRLEADGGITVTDACPEHLRHDCEQIVRLAFLMEGGPAVAVYGGDGVKMFNNAEECKDYFRLLFDVPNRMSEYDFKTFLDNNGNTYFRFAEV